MPAEATMMVLDNSEFMRNGDYAPTRWEAQAEMATLLFRVKRAAHPAAEVGLMTLAGNPEVVVNRSRDEGELLAGLHRVQLSALPQARAALTVAMLALRQRGDPAQHSTVVLFVGSPLQEPEEELRSVGRQLCRNNVALHVFAMEESENEGKLSALVEAANVDMRNFLSFPPRSWSRAMAAVRSLPTLARHSSPPPAHAQRGAQEAHWTHANDPELDHARRRPLAEEQRRHRVRLHRTVDHTGLTIEGEVPEGEPPTAPEPVPLAGKGSMVMEGAEPLMGAGLAADDDREAEMVRQATALARAAPPPAPSSASAGDADQKSLVKTTEQEAWGAGK